MLSRIYLLHSNLLVAIDLAKQGHAVTLNDLSQKSLEIARKNAEKESVTFEAIIHANALDIKQHASEGSFDIVLCLGPLYHLLKSGERTDVIRNSIHMAKSGGYVVLAYVTVYAHLRDMARHDPSRLFKEWEFYETYLHSGVYTRKTSNESYHVYPADLEKELECLKGNAKVLKVVSCEGFLGLEGARALANLRDEELERWIDVVMQSADENQTLNAADHLIVLLQKN
jgi:S-adenosylmethionine-dependent methyltransferase